MPKLLQARFIRPDVLNAYPFRRERSQNLVFPGNAMNPPPFGMAVLFQDNWLDVTGTNPAEVVANRNATKWPTAAYGNFFVNAGSFAFFDTVGNILVQQQSSDIQLTSQAITYNQNKQHTLTLNPLTFNTVASGHVGHCRLAIEANTAFSSFLDVDFSSLGTGVRVALIRSGTTLAAVNGQALSAIWQIVCGPWNGTQRTISVINNSTNTTVINFTDTTGPLGAGTNHVILDLEPPDGGVSTQYTIQCSTITLRGSVT